MSGVQWETVPISQLYQGLYDGPHATPKPATDGPVFLGIKNVTEDGHLDLSGIRHIAEDDFAMWTRRVEPRPGDIVFTYEATLNRYAIIPEGFRGCLGRRMALIRPNPGRVDTRYLHFYFFTPAWRSVVSENTLSGATVDRLPLTRFPEFPVSVPPLAEQRRIAGILSAYDDLIENCERRIRVLDEMARALYREWFVLFRYPGHEKTPLVDSPLGRIPKGWRTEPLERLKAIAPHAINGGPFGSKLVSKDYVADGVPVIRGSNLSEDGRFRGEAFVFVSSQKAQELHANLARPGDIVVTQRGTLGQVGRIPSNIGYDEFVISQSQMKVRLDDQTIDPDYAFCTLRSPESTGRLKSLASSSGVPHINLAVLREFCIVVPPLPLQRQFGSFAAIAEAGIEQLARQARVLRATRDLLLPRLLSGQLAVEAAA